MILLLLAAHILVSSAEVPENNTFIQEYKPPFAQKMEKKAKTFESTMMKKACVSFLDPVECDVLNRINIIRMNEGLAALIPGEKCASLATAHTKYMVGLSNAGKSLKQALNHDKFQERVDGFGLGGPKSRASENVGAGTNLMPEQVVNMWMASGGHKQNILDPAVRFTGLSAIKDAKGNVFWTQCFSTKK